MDAVPAIDPRSPVPAGDTPAVLRTFAAGGAVHVAGAIPAEAVALFRTAAEGVFRSWADDAAAGRLAAEVEIPYQRRFIPLRALPVSGAAQDALLLPVFRALARDYLGKEPELHPDSHVRSVLTARPDAHLPFHQDQTILKRTCLNVWIALDACGEDAPGLELVAGSWGRLLEPEPPENPRFAVEHARIAPESVIEAYGAGALWQPQLQAGDAMLFAGSTIHRTHVTPRMRAGRTSVEMRLY
jgi:hypothetical protein